jgi:beta-fructofuranosidase
MILWGWMYSANKNRGWNGCLALPRVLSLLPDGRLGQEPTPEFETLRRDEQSGRGMRLENTVRRYDVEGGGFEARVKIRAVDAKKSGIRLCEKDGRTAAAIDCAADGVVVSGDRIPAGELGGVTPLDLRIFVDRSLLEVYVNGRASAMRWMDSHRIERLEIYAEKGSADIASMQVWRMESACLYGKGNGSE